MKRHAAIVLVVLLVLVAAFLLFRPGADETDPEQATPPTVTATPA